MSSLQSVLSELCLNNNTSDDDDNDKDDICQICAQWCMHEGDAELNFISCKSCPHSYHKKCVPIIYHSQDNHYNCNEMRNKTTDERLQCCSPSKRPQLLVEIIEDEFEEINYFYDPDDNPIYFHRQSKHKVFKQHHIHPDDTDIFSRTKCRSIKHKGTLYQIGASIEFKSDSISNRINIAIIKDIYLYDEPNKLPDFCVYLYRRQTEIKIQKETETSSEIYFDIESDKQICVDSVLHKVLVLDDIESYFESKDCNFKEFGTVFYCKSSYIIENHTKYNSSPFEDIKMVEIQKKLVALSHDSEERYNKKKKKHTKAKMKSKTFERVEQYLETYNSNYEEGNDEYLCFDLNVPFDLKQKENGEFEKKVDIPLQNGRRLIVDEIDRDILQNVLNNDRFNEEKEEKTRDNTVNETDKDKMKKICIKLNITKGVHVSIKLYGFTEHVRVYETVMNLVGIENDNVRNGKIKNMNSKELRDIKAKIKSEGKVGKKQELIDGVIKKVNEFRINCKPTQYKSSRKRKLFDSNNNNHNTKRRKLMKNN